MKDFFADLYDDDSINEDTPEPTFSIHDFKKWLAKQKNPETLSESVERKKKEDLKIKFKQKIRDKLKKKKE